jgi:hypothetical protein
MSAEQQGREKPASPPQSRADGTRMHAPRRLGTHLDSGACRRRTHSGSYKRARAVLGRLSSSLVSLLAPRLGLGQVGHRRQAGSGYMSMHMTFQGLPKHHEEQQGAQAYGACL